MYHVSLRIRDPYFNAFLAGTKTREVRRADGSETGLRWRKIAAKARDELAHGRPVEAVFLCGKRVHRREIVAVTDFADAVAALGREPSAEGWTDLGHGPVVGFDVLPPRWWSA